jgi:ABC-type phosphate transport system substrate-binding protein
MKGRLAAGVLALVASMSACAGAVVVGRDSPLAAMDADQARRVFLGREPSISGLSITVVDQKEGAVRDEFENKVLGKTGSELAAYWSKLIFTGRAMAPQEAAGDAGVKAKLANSQNAVGYVSDGGVDSSVKVLFRY